MNSPFPVRPGRIAGFALFALGCAHAAVPLAMGRSYDSVGIGMILGAGPILEDHHGLAPNQIVAQGWFHYYPTVIGGAGMELTQRTPSNLESYTQVRYDVTSTWIPWSTPDRALEFSAIGSVNTIDTYLDTLAGADPIEDVGVDFGLALRAAYGHRATSRFGWWVSGAPFLLFRPAGTNKGLNPGLETELGFVYSMSDFWHDARKLSRSWDVFLRIPLRVQGGMPHVSRNGRDRSASWSIGAQIGPSILF